MFKIGDIVRLKNNEKAEWNEFEIINIEGNIDSESHINYIKYRLKAIQIANFNGFKALSAEKFLWSENELELFENDEPKLTYSIDTINSTVKLSQSEPQIFTCTTTSSYHDTFKDYLEKISEELKDFYNKDFYNYEKKEEKDYMKVLEIYKIKKLSEIEHEKQEEKDKVMEQDDLQKILLKAEKEINELLPEDEEFNYGNEYLLTDVTKKKIADIDAKAKEKIEEVDRTIEEVKALFELTEDYTQRIKILEKYGIMKNGKIND